MAYSKGREDPGHMGVSRSINASSSVPMGSKYAMGNSSQMVANGLTAMQNQMPTAQSVIGQMPMVAQPGAAQADPPMGIQPAVENALPMAEAALSMEEVLRRRVDELERILGTASGARIQQGLGYA